MPKGIKYLTQKQITQEVDRVCTLSETDPFIQYKNMIGLIIFSNEIKFKCKIVKGYVYAFNNYCNMKNKVARFIHYTNKHKCFLINILADARYEIIIRNSIEYVEKIYMTRTDFISCVKINNNKNTFIITLPYIYE